MSEIPKIIHYCWFGRNPLPELAVRCIESWKKYFPDYEIKQWNEDNYDVYSIQYTREAYTAKKYAFVSDYARFDILYQHGGVYFDTDVEVIRSLETIVNNGAFMGFEKEGQVASGLGIAAPAKMSIFKEIIDDYKNSIFSIDNIAQETVVRRITNILKKHGLTNEDKMQIVCGLKIYPKEYFAPKDVDTKELVITENTYTIHHYDASWAEWYDKAAGERGPKLKKIFGNKLGGKLNILIYATQKYGVIGIIKKLIF